MHPNDEQLWQTDISNNINNDNGDDDDDDDGDENDNHGDTYIYFIYARNLQSSCRANIFGDHVGDGDDGDDDNIFESEDDYRKGCQNIIHCQQ